MSLRFDLVDLQLFLHVVDAGSITAGAERAHLALASASARIQAMEESLGVPLLKRGRRGVVPTAAGDAMLPHARAMILRGTFMRAELNQFAQGLKGRISMLCNTATLREYLPAALGSFLAAHPLVNIDVQEQPGEEIVAAVIRGSTEIGIVSNSFTVFGLQTRPFCSDRLAIVTPVGHPLAVLAQQRPISVVDADDCDIVALSAGAALQDQWERHAVSRGVQLNYRVRVPCFESQCRLIEQGVGVSLMPEASARRLARTLAVEVLAVEGSDMRRELLLCVRDLSLLPVHTRLLVDHLCGAGLS